MYISHNSSYVQSQNVPHLLGNNEFIISNSQPSIHSDLFVKMIQPGQYVKNVKEGVEPVPKNSGESAERKQTILEAHGYQLGESIGHGSYATVKVANSARHKSKVAIKIISKKRAPQDYLTKFLPREIDVVKILKHPNLVCFLQSIETTNRVYIIMELAENGDLLDVVRREGSINEVRSGKWFHQLVDAIEYCHSKGVVHRDLKCENILLDKRSNMKVTDFGFARGGIKPAADGTPMLSDTYCGSYAYACPEILKGTPYEPQLADIWSMGVILFVLAFGRLPFDDSNLKALLHQVQKPPEMPLKPEVAADWKSLISSILAPARTRVRFPEIRKDAWFLRIYVAKRPSSQGSSRKPSNISHIVSSIQSRGAGKSSNSEPGSGPENVIAYNNPAP